MEEPEDQMASENDAKQSSAELNPAKKLQLSIRWKKSTEMHPRVLSA